MKHTLHQFQSLSFKRQAVLISLLLISLTNFIVIPVKGFAPITLFLLFYPITIFLVIARLSIKLPKLDFPAIYGLISYLLFVNVLNFGQARWPSLAYSILYCTFFLYIHQFGSLISREDLVKISKIIIGLFLINVVFGQLAYYFLDQFYSINWLFQGTPSLKTGAMRFQGFSSEPSYAAFVVSVALLIFIRLSRDTSRVKTIFVLSTVYLTLSFSSVYGYILLLLVLCDWLIREKVVDTKFLVILTFAFSIGFVFLTPNTMGGDRLLNLLYLMMSGNFDLDTLRLLDSSAFMRLGPLFAYFQDINLFELRTYIGNGAGTSATYFGFLFEDVIDITHRGYFTSTINLGFLPAFLFDYGLIGALLVFAIVIRRCLYKIVSIESIIILLLLFNANINTQLFWFVCVMLFLSNHVLRRDSCHRPINKNGRIDGFWKYSSCHNNGRFVSPSMKFNSGKGV